MDKRYEYFSSIAQYGSIQKASEKLYVTSSALSKFVILTEKELGVKLFDRSGKRFVLTYAGERYLDWLQKMDSMNGEMLSEMQDIANANSGRIRIGIQMSRASILVDNIIPAFFKQFPNVRIELMEETSRVLWQALESQRLDLVICPDEVNSVYLEKICLAKCHIALFASPVFQLDKQAKKRKDSLYPWLSPADIRDLPFIAPFSTQDAYMPFNVLYTKYGIAPNIVFHARSIGTILRAVNSGMGVTLTKDLIARINLDDTKLDCFSFGEPSDFGTVQDYVLAYRKDHHLDQSTLAFIKLCRDLFTPKDK